MGRSLLGSQGIIGYNSSCRAFVKSACAFIPNAVAYRGTLTSWSCGGKGPGLTSRQSRELHHKHCVSAKPVQPVSCRRAKRAISHLVVVGGREDRMQLESTWVGETTYGRARGQFSQSHRRSHRQEESGSARCLRRQSRPDGVGARRMGREVGTKINEHESTMGLVGWFYVSLRRSELDPPCFLGSVGQSACTH